MDEFSRKVTGSIRSLTESLHRTSGEHEPADLEAGRVNHGDKVSDDPTEKQPSSVPSQPPTDPSYDGRQQSGNDEQLLKQQQQQQEEEESSQGRGVQLQDQNGDPGTGSVTVPSKRQTTFASAKHSLFSGRKVNDPDPAADRLDDNMQPLSKEDFFELIGMNAPLRKGQYPKELAVVNGLYGKIHRDFAYIQFKYRFYDVATYVLLCLQIVLSAVFIILGALTHIDSHIAIAVLGAVSTVVAGILALMKGQGLPNRLRQTRDALRNVLYEAEELYWDVGADLPVLFKDIKKIREDYLRVMEEARRNHPDTWNQSTNDIAAGITTSSRRRAPAQVSSLRAK